MLLLLSQMCVCVEADNGFKTEEWLSFYFQEITLTNEATLKVTLREGNVRPLEIGNVKSNSYWRAKGGQSFFINRDVPFLFRPIGIRKGSCLALLGRNDVENATADIPHEFLGEHTLIFLDHEDSRLVISPSKQKLYSPSEKSFRDFKFPFRCIWADDKEEERWLCTRKDREKAESILSQAIRIRKGAEILFGRLPAVNDIQFSHVVKVQGNWRQAKMDVSDALYKGVFRPSSVTDITLFVDRENKCEYIVALLIERKRLDDDALTCFRFDSNGHVRWVYTLSAAPEPQGKPNEKKLVMAFEYDNEGHTIRAWTVQGKAGRLWMSSVEGLCPVSDIVLVRKFFSDIRNVMTSKYRLP